MCARQAALGKAGMLMVHVWVDWIWEWLGIHTMMPLNVGCFHAWIF
jgi:hypothetical protein